MTRQRKRRYDASMRALVIEAARLAQNGDDA